MIETDFEFYRKLLKEKSGLSLGNEKAYLIEFRLQPLAGKWGFGSIEMLTEILRTKPDPKLVYDVVEAMTTNETLFFRDDKPFKFFGSTVLPAMLKARENQKKLRIWSAACSTGQEPYSIAMTLTDLLKAQPGWAVEILGTDISEAALKQARSGIYSQFEVQRGLPIQMALKNFTKHGADWQLNENYRNMVRFEAFNLLDRKDRFGTFDLIFCRNVLIYFDEATKKLVLAGLIKQLAPDGYLFLGGSETIIGLEQNLMSVPGCSGLYCHPTNATLGSSVKTPARETPVIAPLQKYAPATT